MAEEKNKNLPGIFENLKEINFGIILLIAYILLDFGAFQGVFDYIVVPLKIPFLIALVSLLYAVYLVMTKGIDWSSSTTKAYVVLTIFYIIDAQIRSDATNAQAVLTLFLQYLSNYIIMTHCVKTPFQFILLLDVFLAGIGHSCFHAIMQGGKLYDSIWLRDENHISLIAAYAIPLSMVFYMLFKSKIRKICYLIVLFLSITANCVAASRGGGLAMLAGGGLWWMTEKKKVRNLIIAMSVVLLVFSFAPKNFFNEMSSLKLGTEEGTANERIYMWELAWMMFCDYPVLGVGPYNYAEENIKYDYKGRFHRRYFEKGKKMVAHSTPIQWLAEEGMIGSIIFFMLVFNLYKNWRSSKLLIERELREDNDAFKMYFSINNACGIMIIVFWVGAVFLTLTPYPFFWILIPFSETWKNLTLNYIVQKK